MLKTLCTFFLVLSVSQVTVTTAKNLPPYIKICRLSDPEVNKCIVKHGNEAILKIRNGDKDYKISSISPLRVNEASIQPGNNLKLTMRDIRVYGLDNLRIIDADVNPAENILKLMLHIPQMQIHGNYTIDGRLVILSIVGHGKANVTMDNMDLMYTLNYKIENGLFGIRNNSIDFTLDRVYYDFDNLFNGEEPLASEMRRFLNENWEDVHKELQGSFNKVISTLVETLVKQIVEGVPFDKVYLP